MNLYQSKYYPQVFYRFILLFCLFTHNVMAEDNTVSVSKLSDIAIYPERSAPATVISLNQSVISAEIAGRIIDLGVDVGDEVKAKQILIKLDCRDHHLALTEIRAQIKALGARITLASRQLERAQKLREQQTLAEEIVDQRSAELSINQADKAALVARGEQIKTQISRCNIRAPYAGVITQKQVGMGEYAMPATPLLTITDTTRLEISAQIVSQDASDLDKTARLIFRHAANDYKVSIRRVVPIIDSQSRDQEVRLTFLDSQPLSGTAGRLIWQESQPHVPAYIMLKREGQLGIFYIDNDQARFFVMPEAQAGQDNPISLPIDTQIIVKGQFALKDGMPVTIE